MSSGNSFTERSLKYFETKLFCSTHGLQPVARLIENNVQLECGCNREQVTPLTEGCVSFEQFSPFALKADRQVAQRLFPAAFDQETTAQRRWGAPLGYAA